MKRVVDGKSALAVVSKEFDALPAKDREVSFFLFKTKARVDLEEKIKAANEQIDDGNKGIAQAKKEIKKAKAAVEKELRRVKAKQVPDAKRAKESRVKESQSAKKEAAEAAKALLQARETALKQSAAVEKRVLELSELAKGQKPPADTDQANQLQKQLDTLTKRVEQSKRDAEKASAAIREAEKAAADKAAKLVPASKAVDDATVALAAVEAKQAALEQSLK